MGFTVYNKILLRFHFCKVFNRLVFIIQTHH